MRPCQDATPDPPSRADVELRTDPLTGALVRVAASRQDRPNRPGVGCPFCVGGVESPSPYTVRTFANRWPSFPDDRCEVVLYGPEHGATLATLGPDRARLVVDLWAERTTELGHRSDVSYVLVFENHGAEVGATIDHPHGQLFAYAAVPPTAATVFGNLESGAPLLEQDSDGARIVTEAEGWRAWVPKASAHPHQVRIAPLDRRPDLASLDDRERVGFARILVDVLGRVQRAFDPPMPYLFWIHQRPTDGGRWPRAWLHVELISPWRSPGVARFVAAGELGGGVLINPVDPDDAAARLRAAR